jgi:hypothetical protein
VRNKEGASQEPLLRSTYTIKRKEVT